MLGAPADRIERDATGVGDPMAAQAIERFDACVVATHADEALALLGDADDDERRLLGAFRYQDNRAVLHRDADIHAAAPTALVELELSRQRRRHGSARCR